MSTPIVAQKGSFPTEVEEGRSYFWCTCGKSSKQPLCDGSHKGTDFTPLKYTLKRLARCFSVDASTVKTGRFAMGATQSFNPLKTA